MAEQLQALKDNAILLEILDQITGCNSVEIAALLLEIIERFHDKIPATVLELIRAKISQEICRRKEKDSVTLLKEWVDQERGRKVFYNFFPMEPGVKAGRVTVIEGKRRWACGVVYQGEPKGDLQRPLKKKLAQMALDKLKEREIKLEEV
jgi:hypothetical protein